MTSGSYSPTIPGPFDASAFARALDGNPDYRVLRRFVPPTDAGWEAPDYAGVGVDSEDVRDGGFVDSETTGLDPHRCKLIQLAYVPFTYGVKSGEIFSIGQGWSWFEDPGEPLSPEIVALTGITDADVKDQHVNWPFVRGLVERSAVIAAHHASFDRRVLERGCSAFAVKPWICTHTDVRWRELFGTRCAQLPHLVRDIIHEFYDAHRALDDCHAAVHLMATARTPDGRTMLSHLLEAARKPVVRLWAIDSPFSVKDRLKERGYEWSYGTDGSRKGWWKEFRDSSGWGEERAWLKQTCGPELSIMAEKVERVDLFSARDKASR